MVLQGEVRRGAELKLEANLVRIVPRADQAFENTLGMKFVPLGRGNLLMSVHETRVADYRAFVQATGHRTAPGANLYSLNGGVWAPNQAGHSWENPGFARNEQHPVSMLTGADAQAFCRWLTARDRATGDLRSNQSYRLPTPDEWMQACRRPDGSLPKYPWGDSWPPSANAGNLAGAEARNSDWPSNWDVIAGWSDRHPRSAPVGSYPANARGIHDLTGNVGEFVLLPDGTVRSHGFGFSVAQAERLTTANYETHGNVGSITIGFRCVLETGVTDAR